MAADVLAVMDAFAATPAQICCGIAVGGGMDENGNGEPPSCCGQPFDTDMLREARAAVAELIEADKYYDDAQFGLARARYNGDPLDQWVKDCAAADIRRAAALASVQGGAA